MTGEARWWFRMERTATFEVIDLHRAAGWRVFWEMAMLRGDQPVFRDIVLVGGGHSHVGVLRSFGKRPIPGVRLTLICTDVHTPYSGMLPGYVAGHYTYDEVHIDLARLAVSTGARLFRGEVVGIDRAVRLVICQDRPPVPYDVLSINIGSSPRVELRCGDAAQVVPVKPIRNFNQRWLALLERVRTHAVSAPETPITIAVVGGGAGGVELSLAMHWRLRNELHAAGCDPDVLRVHLITRGVEILPTHARHVRRQFMKTLAARGIVVHLGAEVTDVADGWLSAGREARLAVDETVWVTNARGAPWLAETGLSLDDNGFIRVTDTLQTVTDPLIFAAGDVASMVNHPLEKAGVFAVRQGKPLAENLRRRVLGVPLCVYRPQRRWLALISTGDRHAVASRAWFYAKGAWVWRWKDWIDRRFMARFSRMPVAGEMLLSPPRYAVGNLLLDAAESRQANSALAMRCGGCAAKIGATPLTRVLNRLDIVVRPDVLIGLSSRDDAAVVRVPPGKAVVHTVDFFRAFIDDPYVLGQVAANNALSDIFAMGAEAQSVTAIATVPPGLEAKIEDALFQMMAGAVNVLNEANCALVGGHSGEGRELALGFAINGLVDEQRDRVLRKGGLRSGDALILTKPLGTGTLFAALARGKVRGRLIDQALVSMLQSNRAGAQCLREFGASACTDVGGFGLLGHIVEMTRSFGVDAEIRLSALPLLDGAIETCAAGIVSSMQESNIGMRRALVDAAAWVNDPRYLLLFDPQTAGGLLAGVPAGRAAPCVAALRALGYSQAAVVGRVIEQGDSLAPVRLLA